ncbi:GrdX family protein [Moorellaceae bacterium AZ2]
MNVHRQVWVVTNNPDIKPVKGRLLFVPEGPLGVFREARKLIFQGYTLGSHPLMGSLKPWQNPYRSVVLLEPAGRPTALDTRSIIIMENAIAMLEAREREVGSRLLYDSETLSHFRHLDRQLVGQTVEV